MRIGEEIQVVFLTKQQEEDTLLLIGDRGVITAIECGGCSINFENDINGWEDSENNVKSGHGWTLLCNQIKQINNKEVDET